MLALVGMPMMAFLAVSSYIYLEQFAIGYVGYSAFYAFTAGVGVLSPFVYLRLSGRVGENAIAKACLVVMGISGVMIGLFGYASALGVLAASVPLFFVEAVFRAQGFVALLEDRTESRGAANSVATFIYSAVSALGTVAASFPLGQLRHGHHGRHAGLHRYGGGHLALSDQETPPAEALSRELSGPPPAA